MERTKLVFNAKEGTVAEVEPIYETRKDCRACFSTSLVHVLNLGEQYLPRFVTAPDPSLPKAPLELVQCASCGLLQLHHSVQSDLLFKHYWYRSSINQSMKDALCKVVEHGLEYHRDGSWLDIGANDGFLLSQVPKRFHRTACEPGEEFQGELHAVSDRVMGDYFTADNAGTRYDVITSIAMFYDLDDPGRFIGDVAKCMNPEGVWINQLNDAPTMLKKNAFDSVCHEHQTYYDVHVLDNLYRQHGLNITRIEFNDVNGGSVRITARKTTRQRAELLGIPKTKWDMVEGFVGRVGKWKERMTDLLTGPMSLDQTYAYGASTKGMVLLQYLGAEASAVIRGCAERNPRKYGLRMAGSWTPIVSEDEMRAAKPRHILVLPWGLSRDEFMRREAETLANGATFVFPLPNIEFCL